MRASELRGLRWSDVDLNKRQIHVRQRADHWRTIGQPKSAAGARTIPIEDMVANTLREWKLQCPKGTENLVFPTGVGTVDYLANFMHRYVDPAMIAAGVVDSKGRAKYGMHSSATSMHHGASTGRRTAGWSCRQRRFRRGWDIPASL